jgi:hypothetical protein
MKTSINIIRHHIVHDHTRCKIEKNGQTIVLTGQEVDELIDTYRGKRFVLNCFENDSEYSPTYSVLDNSKKLKADVVLPWAEFPSE